MLKRTIPVLAAVAVLAFATSASASVTDGTSNTLAVGEFSHGSDLILMADMGGHFRA